MFFLKSHWIDINSWKHQQKVKKKKKLVYRNSVGEGDGEGNIMKLVHWGSNNFCGFLILSLVWYIDVLLKFYTVLSGMVLVL